jgi:hypothetical protein
VSIFEDVVNPAFQKRKVSFGGLAAALGDLPPGLVNQQRGIANVNDECHHQGYDLNVKRVCPDCWPTLGTNPNAIPLIPSLHHLKKG